ncbi:MAG: porphobilinogen synthase [Planctomycetes bacterium]|nr:porphobilinogen synthase [Planctomycetota bacterium]
MPHPEERPRRLRTSPGMRRLVRETRLSVDSLVMPLFIREGENVREPIGSMPGLLRYSPDTCAEAVEKIVQAKIPAVLLFGLPGRKADDGSPAWDEKGAVPSAIREIKKRFPELVVITDVCLCAYTTHGHCGLVINDYIANDVSLNALALTALGHAKAGADVVAPSDMMDGRVKAIRDMLEKEKLDRTAIMSYAVKYASSYYGPFRDAAESAPSFGDRRTHQMDPANVREALREARLDVGEGADMLMVKPALAYLDVIRAVKENFDLPLAAYNVSGEYSMVKAAAEKGWIDEKAVVLETLTAMRRAGADILITYHALDVAGWLREE